VFHDRYELTKYLITNGADPNKQNKRKRSALDIANSKNNSKMIAILEGTKN
jgi:ankyrin repeat protein